MSKTAVGEVVIEEVDLKSLSDDDLAAINEFGNTLRAESRPEDPPTSLELLRRASTHSGLRRLQAFAGRTSDGRIVADAEVNWTTTEDNKHLASISVSVLPSFGGRDRQGAAQVAVSPVERRARRSSSQTPQRRVQAGEAFARRVGAERRLRCKRNGRARRGRPRLVKRWVEEARPGTGDTAYHLDGATRTT